eukprot:211469-Chlamydomonas_euryale.AAC.2
MLPGAACLPGVQSCGGLGCRLAGSGAMPRSPHIGKCTDTSRDRDMTSHPTTVPSEQQPSTKQPARPPPPPPQSPPLGARLRSTTSLMAMRLYVATGRL